MRNLLQPSCGVLDISRETGIYQIETTSPLLDNSAGDCLCRHKSLGLRHQDRQLIGGKSHERMRTSCRSSAGRERKEVGSLEWESAMVCSLELGNSSAPCLESSWFSCAHNILISWVELGKWNESSLMRGRVSLSSLLLDEVRDRTLCITVLIRFEANNDIRS